MRKDSALKEELLSSSRSLFLGVNNPWLLKVVKDNFPTINMAFVLNWIPEQAEDIYWILIDSSRMAVIEIPRVSSDSGGAVGSPLLEFWSVAEYSKRGLSKLARRKLSAALELIGEKKGDESI